MKNNTKLFTDWIKNLTDDDFKKMGEDLDLIREQVRRFYQGKRFGSIIEQIKNELKNVPVIHDNPYTEILFGDVTNEEFNQVFDALFDENVSGLKPKNSDQGDDYYSEEFRVFNGLKFRMISGQGIGLDVSLA